MSAPIKKTYVIEWRGPYSQDSIEELEDKENSGCLYLVSGLVRYEHGMPKLQYIGISDRGAAIRFKDKGHKSGLVIRDKQYWLGHFSNLQQETTRSNLELAEYALIYTCQPPLNVDKKSSQPWNPFVVINRWLNTIGDYREKRIYPAQKTIPDVIIFDGDDFWTCERLKRDR